MGEVTQPVLPYNFKVGCTGPGMTCITNTVSNCNYPTNQELTFTTSLSQSSVALHALKRSHSTRYWHSPPLGISQTSTTPSSVLKREICNSKYFITKQVQKLHGYILETHSPSKDVNRTFRSFRPVLQWLSCAHMRISYFTSGHCAHVLLSNSWK